MSAAAAESVVSASDWIKGIGLSVAASVIGGASKLAIRKSWLLEQRTHHVHADDEDDAPFENQRHDVAMSTAASTSAVGTGSSLSIGVTDPEIPVTHRVAHPATRPAGHPTASSGDPTEYTLQYNSTVRGLGSTRNLSNDRLRRASPVRSTSQWFPLTLRLSGMFGMTVLNPLCCVMAMNYASPSILAPFSGLTLVWIVLFSQPLIGEQPTMPQMLAAGLIVLGEVVVAVFGDHTNDEGVTVSDVRQSYKNGPFLLFIALTTAWFLFLARTILYSKSDVFRRIAWGVSGGSITGFQNFLKDSLTIIKATADTPGQRPWILLAFLIAMAIATAFGGLLLLTACMKRYDATYSAAMFVGSFVITASIMSAFHYDTLDHLDGVVNLVLYPVGLLILMSGVYVLAVTSPAHNRVGNDQDATPRQNSTHALLIRQPPQEENELH